MFNIRHVYSQCFYLAKNVCHVSQHQYKEHLRLFLPYQE